MKSLKEYLINENLIAKQYKFHHEEHDKIGNHWKFDELWEFYFETKVPQEWKEELKECGIKRKCLLCIEFLTPSYHLNGELESSGEAYYYDMDGASTGYPKTLDYDEREYFTKFCKDYVRDYDKC